MSMTIRICRRLLGVAALATMVWVAPPAVTVDAQTSAGQESCCQERCFQAMNVCVANCAGDSACVTACRRTFGQCISRCGPLRPCP